MNDLGSLEGSGGEKGKMWKGLPAFDKILEIVRPLDTGFWLVFQFRDRLTDDIG